MIRKSAKAKPSPPRLAVAASPSAASPSAAGPSAAGPSAASPSAAGPSAAGAAREATKQQTRAALLRAGLELFAEQGLDGPSLDAICERAGFTRGAFYVHFRDRDDFLVAVMESVGEAFLDAVLGGPEEDLFAMMQRFVASVASNAYPLMRRGGVRPYQLLDACARVPKLRQRYVRLVSDTLARLTRGAELSQERGHLRRDVAPASIASVLLASVIGAHTLADLGKAIDVAEGAAALVRMLAAEPSRG